MMEHYSHVRNAAKRKAVDAMRGWTPEPGEAEATYTQPERVQ